MKNNLLSIQGTLIGDDVGIITEQEEHKPKKKKSKV